MLYSPVSHSRVDIALSASPLYATPLHADINSWLVIPVDSAGLRLGSIDGLMGVSGGNW
jgi:hypothetical protein